MGILQGFEVFRDTFKMKKVLAKRRSATVAIRIVSSTKLLDQFAGNRVASIERDQGQLIWVHRTSGRR